ncbi:hypothetical protein G4Y79_09975 [Phototrophicus methaneseepsis]|uniref:Uncharacterized protein n=1 Tax=Phototrophicus methaneseepsis TaxID=2710758 RepID=A0A7S8ECX6_9CHLR|nr:hypothetical protein [Phototrophicus methaneseepsis]QPC84682.1 hypothetical protein G4Y79_09975 [Phototrophicus methaneseepsis]
MMGIFSRFDYLSLSWNLWRFLLYPPENPIFRRVVNKDFGYKSTIAYTAVMMLIAAIVSVMVCVYLAQFRFLFPIILLIVLTIFSSAITVFWMIGVISEINYEYDRDTYDLICVAPSGVMGANWSIAAGIVHRRDIFSWVDFGRRAFSSLLFFILLIVFLMLILVSLQNGGNHPLEWFLLLIEIAILAIFTYAEYVHSVILGLFVALFCSQYVHQGMDTGIGAILLFIALQMLVLMIFLFGNLIIPSHVVFKGQQLSFFLPQVLLLYATHEVFIFILWSLFLYRTNADKDSFFEVRLNRFTQSN